jgi:RNA polymerase sigma-70 factor (sigma-E family)
VRSDSPALGRAGPAAAVQPQPGPESAADADHQARSAVTALYQAHALSLTRLAHVMLGDKAAAEDVVQEAYWGLFRNWSRLADPARAAAYLRACVLNGCRSAGRRRMVRRGWALHEPAVASAESVALAGEERRSVLPAIRRLPARQREVLILRFYLGEPDAEIARVMGISPSTVRSSTHRALAALERLLKAEQ